MENKIVDLSFNLSFNSKDIDKAIETLHQDRLMVMSKDLHHIRSLILEGLKQIKKELETVEIVNPSINIERLS